MPKLEVMLTRERDSNPDNVVISRVENGFILNYAITDRTSGYYSLCVGTFIASDPKELKNRLISIGFIPEDNHEDQS